MEGIRDQFYEDNGENDVENSFSFELSLADHIIFAYLKPDCLQVKEKSNRNGNKRLLDWFMKYSKEVIHRLENNTATNRDKLNIITFLCQSGLVEKEKNIPSENEEPGRNIEIIETDLNYGKNTLLRTERHSATTGVNSSSFVLQNTVDSRRMKRSRKEVKKNCHQAQKQQTSQVTGNEVTIELMPDTVPASKQTPEGCRRNDAVPIDVCDEDIGIAVDGGEHSIHDSMTDLPQHVEILNTNRTGNKPLHRKETEIRNTSKFMTKPIKVENTEGESVDEIEFVEGIRYPYGKHRVSAVNQSLPKNKLNFMQARTLKVEANTRSQFNMASTDYGNEDIPCEVFIAGSQPTPNHDVCTNNINEGTTTQVFVPSTQPNSDDIVDTDNFNLDIPYQAFIAGSQPTSNYDISADNIDIDSPTQVFIPGRRPISSRRIGNINTTSQRVSTDDVNIDTASQVCVGDRRTTLNQGVSTDNVNIGTSTSQACIADGQLTLNQRLRPHLCKLCGKQFEQKGHLHYHLRIHSGEKPFLCQICGKSFRSVSNLKGHITSHTGKKKFQCPYCNKKFAANSNLKIHIRTHTGEKPYLCERCRRGFNTKSHLIYHSKHCRR
ncbi:uncharacterized protein LOC144445504 [Glandiceps talaboti]